MHLSLHLSLATTGRVRFTLCHGCGGKPAGWGRSPAVNKPQVNESISQFGAALRGVLDRWTTVSPAASVDGMGGAWFEEWALRLFRLQLEFNAAYRTECSGSGVTAESVQQWQAIPAVPTVAFKELTLTSLPVERRLRVFQSSGTTGQIPSRHFHDAESLALYEASLWPWFRRHLLPSLDAEGAGGQGLSPVPVFLTPPPAQVPNSSLAHMLGCVAREMRSVAPAFFGAVDADASWHLRPEALTEAFARACDSGSPVLLAGTAFNFVHLLDHLQSTGTRWSLPAGSRVMETGGYKGRSRVLSRTELHEGLTGRLGVPGEWIVSEYGMSELSSQAYDAVVGEGGVRRLRFPPWARAVVVSVETGREVKDGDTGLLRIVDLANAWSVLAVQTEDLAVRRGDGFELLGRAPAAEARGCSLRSFGGS